MQFSCVLLKNKEKLLKDLQQVTTSNIVLCLRRVRYSDGLHVRELEQTTPAVRASCSAGNKAPQDVKLFCAESDPTLRLR